MLLADSVRRLAARAGSSSEIEEPEFEKPCGGNRSAGIVVVDDLGRGDDPGTSEPFRGLRAQLREGSDRPRRTPQHAAHRELTEETGLLGRIVGLIGDFAGHTSVMRFYVGVRTGGEERPSAETWAVKTVNPFAALGMLNVKRDQDVLVGLVELAAGVVGWPWTIGGQPTRCRFVDGRIRCIAIEVADGARTD